MNQAVQNMRLVPHKQTPITTKKCPCYSIQSYQTSVSTQCRHLQTHEKELKEHVQSTFHKWEWTKQRKNHLRASLERHNNTTGRQQSNLIAFLEDFFSGENKNKQISLQILWSMLEKYKLELASFAYNSSNNVN